MWTKKSAKIVQKQVRGCLQNLYQSVAIHLKYVILLLLYIASNFLKWKSGTGHTHQLTITHIPMNIIKSRKQGEKPEQAEVKKTEKISTLECKSGSGCLAGSWLSINLLLSQLCQLDCLVPVQITMFTTRLFTSQTELPGQQ